MANSKCLVIGHRGASRIAPENTLSSVREAIRLGVDMVEIDVQLTRDLVPIVLHSPYLKNEKAKRQKVSDLDFSLIRRFDVGSLFSSHFRGERIPRLEEILEEALPKIQVNIELKTQNQDEGALVREVVKRIPKSYDRRIIYSSFSWTALKYLRKVRPQVRLGLLFKDRWHYHVKMARTLNCYSLHPKYSICQKSLVRLAHEEGFHVLIWTVNRLALMSKFMGWGVDGLFTDVPDKLLTLRSKASS